MQDRILLERLRRSKQSVLLLGPRQVGKTTLAQSLKPALSVNLADEAIFLRYSKDPARLRREILALGQQPKLILIDEVQRIPTLLNTVQAIIDESQKSIRFLLTGSSARKLRRGGANLLPGRVILEYLDPLSIWEMPSSFDLDRALRVGSLPGVYLDRAEGEEVLESYSSIYLREEVQAEAMTKNLGAYARFLDLAADASGQWINYSKVSSDSEIGKETIRRFFQVLEDTLLAVRIAPFEEKASKRRVSQRDRFLFFDLGVRNAIFGLHKAEVGREERGKRFEQWVILQVIAFIHAHRKPWRLFSYRTNAGAEVDLIIDFGKKILALECKTAVNVTEESFSGLRSFATFTKRPTQSVVIYCGSTRQKFGAKEMAIPYLDFLLQDLPSYN